MRARLTSQFEACLEALRKEADERAKELAAQQREALEAVSLAVLDHHRAVVDPESPRSAPRPVAGRRSERRCLGARPFQRHQAEIDRAREDFAAQAREAEEANLVAAAEQSQNLPPEQAGTDIDRLLDDLVRDVRVIGEST